MHCCLFLFSVLEYQVRSIASHVRPDRQSKWVSSVIRQCLISVSSKTQSVLFCFLIRNMLVFFTALLFSATFRKKIERLARDILVDPIRVVQGDIGEVCSVTQYLQTYKNIMRASATLGTNLRLQNS